jgi:hypothetical protein
MAGLDQIPTTMDTYSFRPTSSSAFIVIYFIDDSQSDCGVVESQCFFFFIFICLMTKNAEHLFMYS